MAKLFYEGTKPTVLSFLCRTRMRDIEPSSALATIFADGRGEVVLEAKAKLIENTVSYELPNEVIDKPDEYVAIFDLIFPPHDVRRHTIMFTVAPRRVRGTYSQVAKLDKTSNPHVVDNAVSAALKEARSGGQGQEAIKTIFLDAQSRVGRRIEH